MFIGAAAISANPGALRGAIDHALRNLRVTWPDRASLDRLQHLHFQRQKPDERIAVLRSLARHNASQRSPNACILVVAVLPISVFAASAKKESIYIEGTGWLLRQLVPLLPKDAELDLYLDDPVGGNREKKKRLLSAVRNLAEPAWVADSLSLEFAHKEQERLIQWADYVAGATLQRWLRGNSAPWDVISPFVHAIPSMPLLPGELQRHRY
ncbi:MAG: hypothetical protein ACRDHP_09260 [Ktedonobacterales bacterium]